MKSIHFLFVSSLMFISAISWAVNFKPGFVMQDSVKIPATCIDLELLVTPEDTATLMALAEKNLEDDYIKSLYGEDPKYVGKGTLRSQIYPKVNRNGASVSAEGLKSRDFYRNYYAIKLKETRKIIGSTEIYSSSEGAELGLFVDGEYAHQGYGSEAARAAVEFLKEKTTVKGVQWDCFSDNVGSNGVVKKCGFQLKREFRLYGNRMASAYFLPMERSHSQVERVARQEEEYEEEYSEVE